jgi:hypothetical protein
MNTLYEQLVEQIKKIDRDDLSNDVTKDASVKEVEKQKVYIWLRVFLKDDASDVKEGDDFTITYTKSGEQLNSKFMCFGKVNSFKDNGNNQIQTISEDDPKVIILMIDENDIQNGEHIPFIRTLFKISKHFEYQVYRRDELVFKNERSGQILEYIDCEF